MKRPFPDRKKLEVQCVSSIAFVKNEADLLDSPIWIMLLNVVALEMLKAKMPDGKGYLFRKMFLNHRVSIFYVCYLSFNQNMNSNIAEGSNISQPLHAQQANGRGPNNVRNNSSEPRKRFLASGSSDEDPYSLTPSGSSGSSGKASNFENINCLRKHSILLCTPFLIAIM